MAKTNKKDLLDETSRDALRVAWESVEPRLSAAVHKRDGEPEYDPRAVLAVVQPVAVFLMSPDARARLEMLPEELFAAGQSEALVALVGALRWAILQRDAAREQQTEVVLDDVLAEQANALRARMSKVVLHYFEDDEELGPTLKPIGRRRGHMALAHDLKLLAELYEKRREVVERDPKYWQPNDIEDARAAAALIESAVEKSTGDAAREWELAIDRVLLRLVEVYSELRAAGCFLWRKDPAVDHFAVLPSVRRPRRASASAAPTRASDENTP